MTTALGGSFLGYRRHKGEVLGMKLLDKQSRVTDGEKIIKVFTMTCK